MSCYGCACNNCLYNAELESWYRTVGEIQDVEDICYNCDECRNYDGDHQKRSQLRPECSKHRLPAKYIAAQREAAEREAQRRRAAFRLIKGGEE